MLQKGFAYLILLFVLAAIALTLTSASQDVDQNAQREREAELLFIGKQFHNAIASYYEKSPNSNKQFPKKLEDLVTDNRSLKPARHLRKIYIDPMTGKAEWGLVKNEQDMIIGIYSTSDLTPLRSHFDIDIKQMFGENPLSTYSDWKFVYQPGIIQATPTHSDTTE